MAVVEEPRRKAVAFAAAFTQMVWEVEEAEGAGRAVAAGAEKVKPGEAQREQEFLTRLPHAVLQHAACSPLSGQRTRIRCIIVNTINPFRYCSRRIFAIRFPYHFSCWLHTA